MTVRPGTHHGRSTVDRTPKSNGRRGVLTVALSVLLPEVEGRVPVPTAPPSPLVATAAGDTDGRRPAGGAHARRGPRGPRAHAVRVAPRRARRAGVQETRLADGAGSRGRAGVCEGEEPAEEGASPTPAGPASDSFRCVACRTPVPDAGRVSTVAGAVAFARGTESLRGLRRALLTVDKTGVSDGVWGVGLPVLTGKHLCYTFFGRHHDSQPDSVP